MHILPGLLTLVMSKYSLSQTEQVGLLSFAVIVRIKCPLFKYWWFINH